jgi:hypothetical protein
MDDGTWLDELEFSWQVDELMRTYKFTEEKNMQCDHKHYSKFNLTGTKGGDIYQCDDCGKVIFEPWRKTKILFNIAIGFLVIFISVVLYLLK